MEKKESLDGFKFLVMAGNQQCSLATLPQTVEHLGIATKKLGEVLTMWPWYVYSWAT